MYGLTKNKLCGKYLRMWLCREVAPRADSDQSMAASRSQRGLGVLDATSPSAHLLPILLCCAAERAEGTSCSLPGVGKMPEGIDLQQYVESDSQRCPSDNEASVGSRALPQAGQGQDYVEGCNNKTYICYKCHQPGHWARDCPGEPADAQVKQGTASQAKTT
jgi:hypothetical protein